MADPDPNAPAPPPATEDEDLHALIERLAPQLNAHLEALEAFFKAHVEAHAVAAESADAAPPAPSAPAHPTLRPLTSQEVAVGGKWVDRTGNVRDSDGAIINGAGRILVEASKAPAE